MSYYKKYIKYKNKYLAINQYAGAVESIKWQYYKKNPIDYTKSEWIDYTADLSQKIEEGFQKKNHNKIINISDISRIQYEYEHNNITCIVQSSIINITLQPIPVRRLDISNTDLIIDHPMIKKN